MFPSLKSQLRLPGDRLLLQTLEQNVRELMALETDRDVSNAIRMVCRSHFASAMLSVSDSILNYIEIISQVL